MKEKAKNILQMAAMLAIAFILCVLFFIPGAWLVLALALGVFAPHLKRSMEHRLNRWRSELQPRMVMCENNGVVGVWFYKDYLEALRKQSAQHMKEKRLIPLELTRIPGGMSFVDAIRITKYHTGSISDMELLLRGCNVEGRPNIFVPCSSGIGGTYEEQRKRGQVLSLEKAHIMVAIEKERLKREHGRFGQKTLLRHISRERRTPATA